jgi:hypothetical protein
MYIYKYIINHKYIITLHICIRKVDINLLLIIGALSLFIFDLERSIGVLELAIIMQLSACIKTVIIYKYTFHIYNPKFNIDKENPHKYYNNKINMPINFIRLFSLINIYEFDAPYTCISGAKRPGVNRLSGRKVSAWNVHQGETSRIQILLQCGQIVGEIIALIYISCIYFQSDLFPMSLNAWYGANIT